MPLPPKSYAHAPRLPEGPAVDLGEILPGDGPLLLEIGSGRGMFALDYAALRPDHRVMALEIRRKYATLLAEKMASRGLRNARCFAEDAREALPRLRPDGGVAFVAVHFPDPWWKRRHSKRLVIGDVVLAELERLVAPGGVVFVQTDVEARAAEYEAALLASGAFVREAPPGERFAPESPFAPARSNREARAIADALPIHRLVFRRAGALSARTASLPPA